MNAANDHDDVDDQLQDSLDVPATDEDLPDRGQLVQVPELQPPFPLQLLLSFLYDNENNAIPLTVTTSGGVIFGMAVHPAAWFRAMAEQTRALPSTTGDNVALAFDTLAKDAVERYKEREQDVTNIGFIYFTRALIVPPRASGYTIYSEPAAWQVNLQHVVAWTIGSPPD